MKKHDDHFGNCRKSLHLIESAGFCVEKALESSGGDVFLARSARSNNLVVVKRFHGPQDKCFEAKERFLWEDHEHIVRILDVISVKVDSLMVTEFAAGGDLYTHFQEIGVFPEFLARILMFDLVKGVSLLHRVGICHRDLKPENCVLDANGVLKIIDFGLAARFEEKTMLSDFCGSLDYVAPEILFRQSYRGPDVDVWACGTVLFEMVVGEVPFVIKDSENQNGCNIFKFPEALVGEAHLSVGCTEVLRHVLCVDPEKRLKLYAVFDSAWMVENHVFSVDDIDFVQNRAPKSVLLKRLNALLRGQVDQDMFETNKI